MILGFILALSISLQEELRPYIENICEQYSIAPTLVEAMIEVESSWDPEAINGTCTGLMQISTKWHMERAKDLGVTDLLDPKGNILVGIDYLGELFNRYEDVGLVLDKYNGNLKAWDYYEQGELSPYAKKVTELSAELEKEREKENEEVKKEVTNDTLRNNGRLIKTLGNGRGHRR
jgi:soluble lytic murein transglycosylase-like protein